MKTENKKNIERKSIVDGNIYPIAELVRFSKSKEGKISFDPSHSKKGRGAYCQNNISEIDILFKRKLLNKSFKQNITQEQYDELKNEVNIWIKNKLLKENQM